MMMIILYINLRLILLILITLYVVCAASVSCIVVIFILGIRHRNHQATAFPAIARPSELLCPVHLAQK
jgi:hypothetical protein